MPLRKAAKNTKTGQNYHHLGQNEHSKWMHGTSFLDKIATCTRTKMPLRADKMNTMPGKITTQDTLSDKNATGFTFIMPCFLIIV